MEGVASTGISSSVYSIIKLVPCQCICNLWLVEPTECCLLQKVLNVILGSSFPYHLKANSEQCPVVVKMQYIN